MFVSHRRDFAKDARVLARFQRAKKIGPGYIHHRGCAFLCVLVCLLAAPAWTQTTISVPGNAPTIQAAIDTAIDGDTVLVAPGTYVENIDFRGKAITVTSSGGPATTTIDGGQ